jgi:mycothiol synthase
VLRDVAMIGDMAYLWRALEAADTQCWSALTKIVSDADDTDEFYVTDDLAEELEDPAIDPTRDTIAVEDEHGSLVAVGQVMEPTVGVDGVVRADFAGFVHPDQRGRGVGAGLLERLQRRAGEVAAQRHPGRSVVCRTHVGASVRDARALLEANGYRVTRYFHALGRRLDERLLAPAEDPRVHLYDTTRDAEVHAAHCEAFRTHWGFAPPTQEQWNTWLTGSRTFRPGYSVVGLGADEHVDGYLLSYQYQPGELWIGQLGVRPAARGQGLARAMLLRTLALAASAFEIAKLDVDSENPDGAGRLYESVGFTALRSSVIYDRAG